MQTEQKFNSVCQNINRNKVKPGNISQIPTKILLNLALSVIFNSFTFYKLFMSLECLCTSFLLLNVGTRDDDYVVISVLMFTVGAILLGALLTIFMMIFCAIAYQKK